MAENHLHVFAIDLQSLEPAIFGNDMPFAFFRFVDRGEPRNDAVGRDHSQNIKTFYDCAGVGYEGLGLAAPSLARNMRVGGLKTHEILKVEILGLRHRDSTDRR